MCPILVMIAWTCCMASLDGCCAFWYLQVPPETLRCHDGTRCLMRKYIAFLPAISVRALARGAQPKEISDLEAHMGIQLPWQASWPPDKTSVRCLICTAVANMHAFSGLCCMYGLQVWELYRYRNGQLITQGAAFAYEGRLLCTAHPHYVLCVLSMPPWRPLIGKDCCNSDICFPCSFGGSRLPLQRHARTEPRCLRYQVCTPAPCTLLSRLPDSTLQAVSLLAAQVLGPGYIQQCSQARHPPGAIPSPDGRVWRPASVLFQSCRADLSANR